MSPLADSRLSRRLAQAFIPPFLFALQGCSMMFPPTLTAPRIAALPSIDGTVDPAWDAAPALLLEARGNTLKEQRVPVELRALHDGERVAMLFRWEDDTPSIGVRRIEWNAAGEPQISGVPDDQFAIKFNLGGSRFSCMLAGKPVTSDVWSWKAGRTNPGGFAQDRLFIVRPVSPDSSDTSGGTPYRALNGKPVEIVWQEDSGDPLVLSHPAQGAPNSSAPESTLGIPSGSQADVLARGTWKDGIWTLEVARVFDTGHPDDAAIASGGEVTKFSIAVFDQSEGQVHANTRSIKLKPAP